MTKLDIIDHSNKLNLLPRLDRNEVALFNGEPYFTIMSIADLLGLEERQILDTLRNYEFVCVDLEFQERKDTYVVHDGESATGRPLVMGVSWFGLKCLVMEFDKETTRELAHDIITVEFEFNNPQSLARYYQLSGNKSIGLNK